jgi:hypothetical protein
MTDKPLPQYRLLRHVDDHVVAPEEYAGPWVLWVIAGILIAACLFGIFALVG